MQPVKFRSKGMHGHRTSSCRKQGHENKNRPFCNLHSVSKKTAWTTEALNVYVIHIKFLQNAPILRKLNPLNFALFYWKFHFLDHFNYENQLYWIVRFLFSSDLSCKNSVEFYKYERHSIFSVRKSLCLALQGSKFDPRDEIQVY